ncbi:MAG: YjbF family lipoprotein [Loktanella sp.]|nr:YjbF family lipoprotein [Loktanella sp.]
MRSLPLFAQRPRRALPVLALAACALILAFGGCDRIGPALDVTGKVEQVPPRPIAAERLRVVLPTTGADATLAPVSRRGDVTVWQTLDGITVTFRGGVLIATRGLGDDLMSSDVQNTLAMLRGSASSQYYPQIRSHLDGENQTRFRSYQCRRNDLSVQQTRIGTITRSLTRVTEHCVSPDNETTNTYWLDPTGTVLKSRQWVRPDIGYMETEYVRR